jgi:kinesin family member 6/9
VFNPESTQEEVFNLVAKQCVMSALDGFNSTVFAYGQTGSGKTWSVAGGTLEYKNRGIIPRAIALVYEEVEKRKDRQWNINVSYLEIYNQKGYDLLSPDHDTSSLNDLQRVTLFNDGRGNINTNLRSLPARTIDDCLSLLFLGAANRTMSETAMNETSSRSHCIFTLILESWAPDSDIKRISKLHLVDLAG